MSMTPSRFSRLRRVIGAVCIVGMLCAIVVAGAAALDYVGPYRLAVAGAAIAGFVLIAIGWGVSALLLKIESAAARQLDTLRDVEDLLKRQATALELIVENTRISDAAKALTHRGEELDALRVAVQHEIRLDRWGMADKLLDAMESRFGAHEEAAALRTEVNEARRLAIDGKLSQAIELVERHFSENAWGRARKEIEKLTRLFPDDAKVGELPRRLEQARSQHKADLMMAWREAVARSDTDRAIDLLKELDQYLTPEDAQSMQDDARHVFKDKLSQLGLQFRFAVSEKRWGDALGVGLELIREFPNSRMADEVRSTLDVLRERAHHSKGAEPDVSQ